jgi:hypothetical protein
MRRRQLRVHLDRRLQLGLRVAIVLLAKVGHPHQQVALGGLAGAEDAIDVSLPFVRFADVQQRGAEQVRVSHVAAEHRLARLQQRHHLRVLAGLHVAVGEDQVRGLRLGIGREHTLELFRGLAGPRRLVVREREIEANLRIARIDLQRGVVLLDRVVVLAELRVGRAEIRERVRALGRDGERRLVAVDRAQQIARLVELHRPCEQAVEVRLRLRGGRSVSRRSFSEGGRLQQQDKRKNRPPHGHSILNDVGRTFRSAQAKRPGWKARPFVGFHECAPDLKVRPTGIACRP